MIKIDKESYSFENYRMDMVTLDSDVNGMYSIGISLDSADNRVIITSLHLEQALKMRNTSKIMEKMDEDLIIENFESLGLAEYFFEEMKHPLKLSAFVKRKLKRRE